VLVDRLGAPAVAALDPSSSFVAECAARHPGVVVREGRAEAIPFDDASFDAALAQLVLHFVAEPASAAAELGRVLRPGALVGACVWDFSRGMQMLRLFWDAALAVDPSAPDEARTRRFGRPGEIVDLLVSSGFDDVVETTLEVRATYTDFDDLWAGFLAGVGPAGSYCVSLDEDRRDALRGELFGRLGAPGGGFSLAATARWPITTRSRAPRDHLVAASRQCALRRHAHRVWDASVKGSDDQGGDDMQLQDITAAVKDAVTVKRVFGEPYERDGIAVIPAATMAGGSGGGTGKDSSGGEGEGGGFGVVAKPAGVYLVKDGDVQWRPAVDPNRIISVVGAVVIVALLCRAVVERARAKAPRQAVRRRSHTR
jgi:uncharacterized spore protein YtfJ